MRRSRLELYEAILTALSEKALLIDDIAYECKTDCVLLKERLAFLLKHNLIEEKMNRKKRFYGLTHRGEAIFKTLTIAKRLEKLQTNSAIDQALQIMPAFPENEEEEANDSTKYHNS
jgi:predicted transcriptional regulator